MTEEVTPLDSSELASQLEELSELASQIAHRSKALRTVFQSDPLASSASACVLLHVALSNAQGCLSLLQSMNQAPTPPPYVVLSPGDHPINSPCSPTPTFTATISPLPAVLAGISLPSWSSPPATQRWPLPPIPPFPPKAEPEPITYPYPGGRSVNEYSPLPPLFNRTRHGVSIAELVDEENTSPGTRGGVNRPSRSAATSVVVPTAHTYPPLSLSIVDVTPRSAVGPECPAQSRVIPLRSPPRSPPISPASNDRRRTASEVGKIPRRSKRKAASMTEFETTGQRVTRSITNRKAAKDSELETRPSKRAKSACTDERDSSASSPP